MDDGEAPLPDGTADVVCCLETIEHLENPRALARDLTRLVKPGGLLVVSTPNQLSLLSKLCLVVNNEFVHFQERPGLYPAHLSALLECDLRRIARESGWTDVAVAYTAEGRMPIIRRTATFNRHRNLILSLIGHPPARRVLMRRVLGLNT